MTHRQLKIGYFTLEGLNSFATVYYLYYFYFFMSETFGFGNKLNLCLAALNGAVYALLSLYGGRFAQKQGYFRALKLGFGTMLAALLVGSQLHSATGQILMMAVMVAGMCFTWPTLEALVSEGETREGVQQMVGIYNIVWAATGAVAYFIGGALLQTFGLKSLFYVPVAVQIGQFSLTVWLERQAKAAPVPQHGLPSTPAEPIEKSHYAISKRFLRLAWLANPFAYIAINTLVAVIPGVASRLNLSTMQAGFVCSLWCFARLGAFVGLWHWTAWHYRFSWLLTAYLGLIASFATILMVPNLATLILAQVILGGALGLIYYSSLYYSMDVGDTKGEHGGIHEAAIGLGNFAGPAVGAASLALAPQFQYSGAIAVSCLLLFGLGGLLVLNRN